MKQFYYIACSIFLLNSAPLLSWPVILAIQSKSVLRKAIEANDYPSITQLLAEGHSINEQCEEITALRKMVESDNEPMVNFLLDNGAEMGSCLYIAVLNGRDNIIKLLLKRGANPILDPGSALEFANTEILFQFMDHGLDLQSNIITIVDRLKKSQTFTRNKLTALFSHSWIKPANRDYKKYVRCLKTLFLMHNRSGTLFSLLPGELLLHICAYLPGGFWLNKGNNLEEHKNRCIELEIERRLEQLGKLLRTHKVSGYKQKLRDEERIMQSQNLASVERSATTIIGYLDPKKITTNWGKEIQQQVAYEWEQSAVNKKKRKFDEINS